MSKYTEQQFKKCRHCNRKTMHYRNNNKMGVFGWLLNIVLLIATVGAWLIPMFIGWLLTRKIGGWNCGEC